uniref:Uncharacterized protein n=1 Tax=Gossypium raimondii TaxID=29730 RepID=A0A0D2VGS5_GOSRA|nr:hypothetical protein B456_011G012400 [Gossypium raimondii]
MMKIYESKRPKKVKQKNKNNIKTCKSYKLNLLKERSDEENLPYNSFPKNSSSSLPLRDLIPSHIKNQ